MIARLARLAVIATALASAVLAVGATGGCATIVGIDDHEPLVCDQLYVLRDDGRRVDVAPQFESTVTDYAAIVSPLTIAIQIVITCRDPVATITAAGVSPDAHGATPFIFLFDPITDIAIDVRAPTDPPAPQIEYHLAVRR